MNRVVETRELFVCTTPYLCELFDLSTYPWDILPKIKDYTIRLMEKGIDGFCEISPGVWVGKNVKIYPTAVIEGPAIIGEGSEVRPGAFIRGSVVTGKNCVLGNSSEFKNSVLLDNVQAPHYNYVGDSVIGNFGHLGAGTVCSNLKSDGKPVVIHADTDYETGLRKIGGILADHADIGCGCVINPGTVIGKNTSVYPLTALRGVIGEGYIVKSPDNIVKRK